MFRRLLGLVVLTAACGRVHVPHPSMPSMPSMSRSHDDGRPSDANIVAIMLAANNTDISYAKLVPSHTRTPAVRDFAQRMEADHRAVNDALTDLTNHVNLAPEENKESLAFRDESTAKREMLKQVQGSAFDSTYIANEINFHAKLLTMLDLQLIPSARGQGLKQILTQVRPKVAAHLEHARQVQSGLKR